MGDPFAIDAAFWRGKRVFVTGHTGFKGGWLLNWLSLLGAEVAGYALPPETQPSMFHLLRLDELCHHSVGDVRNAESLTRAIRGFKPDIVLHLAAQPLVRRSYHEPVSTFEINVMGTVLLLEACRGVDGLGAVVIVTTDKCYENREWDFAYRENDPLGGVDPYSASKACAELVAHSYRKSFFSGAGPAIASARAGNVVGGGDWSEDRLIPDAARAFANGDALRIRSPRSVRPWQHVLEPLGGYLRLARACYEGGADYAGGWNFGPSPDQFLKVEDVIGMFTKAWGEGAGPWEVVAADSALHEGKLLLLESGQAIRKLFWHPALSFEETIGTTVEWYKAYYDNAADDDRHQIMRTLTRKQIVAFESKL